MAALMACPRFTLAQNSGILTAIPPQKVVVKRGATVESRLALRLQSGYHVNSNTPNEAYLIPLRLKWDPGALEAVDIQFPKPEQKNYQFSSKPVSVFTGDFEILTRFKPAANAVSGPGILSGKLRYQACTNSSCMPPRTIDIRLPFIVIQ